MSLSSFLQENGLENFEAAFRGELGCTEFGDLAFCEDKDLASIGIKGPKQRRLKQALADARQDFLKEDLKQVQRQYHGEAKEGAEFEVQELMDKWLDQEGGSTALDSKDWSRFKEYVAASPPMEASMWERACFEDPATQPVGGAALARDMEPYMREQWLGRQTLDGGQSELNVDQLYQAWDTILNVGKGREWLEDQGLPAENLPLIVGDFENKWRSCLSEEAGIEELCEQTIRFAKSEDGGARCK